MLERLEILIGNENINKIKSVVMSIKENLDCSVLKKV